MKTFHDCSQVVWHRILYSDRKELKANLMPLNSWIRVFLEKLVVTCYLRNLWYLKVPYCVHKRLTVNMMCAVDNNSTLCLQGLPICS